MGDEEKVWSVKDAVEQMRKEMREGPECEACSRRGGGAVLELSGYQGKDRYQICLNCLSDLVNFMLSPEQFKKLLSSGHTTNEFHLHDDFYDEDGVALQPRF